jgi:hypothetical protein
MSSAAPWPPVGGRAVDRELVLVALLLIICGPLVLAFGPLPAFAKNDRSARRLERQHWTRLWAPLLPAALAFASLLGWAIQEPEATDERLQDLALVLAVPFAYIWLRALVRAGWSLLVKREGALIATVGLLHPRLALSPAVHDAMDAAALQAACKHEAAHARHRDPLRIWLAQLAANLQWPWPNARTRLRCWLWALEAARDEEAREHGAEGADLAAAILAAVALQSAPATAPAASLTGDGAALKERIGRLLVPVARDRLTSGARWLTMLLVVLALSAAVFAGVLYGDLVVRALPGIVT